jgi:hypothetical protein
MEIGAADATGLDAKQNVAFARRGYGQVFKVKRILLNRHGVVKDGGSHDASASNSTSLFFMFYKPVLHALKGRSSMILLQVAWNVCEPIVGAGQPSRKRPYNDG